MRWETHRCIYGIARYSSGKAVIYVFALFFQTFDINAFLKLDQDSTADLSKVSCIDDSVLHNTIKSQDGGHEGI